MASTLDELREKAAAATKELAEAEALHADRPALKPDLAVKRYEEAMERHATATSDKERHGILNEALLYLEHNKVTGPIIDRLAQLVVNARGE